MNALPTNYKRPPRDPAKIAEALAKIDDGVARSYASLQEKRYNTEHEDEIAFAKSGTME